MPLGPFRLMALETSRGALVSLVESHLARLPWLAEVKGATVYAVGGIWRAFAKVHMEHTGHPLHIIHHYGINANEAVEFAQLLSRQSRLSLEGSGIARRRIEALPYAAMFMECLLERARPAKLVFSAYGLREGILHDLLPPETRALDPLLAACDDFAGRVGRFGDPELLKAWVRGLGEPFARHARLATATCLLSDIGWLEHPDYRSEQAYLKALRTPLGGIDHMGRAFIALALHTRYGGRMDDPAVYASHALLKPEEVADSVTLGLALRLAYTLCGGALSLLDGAALTSSGGRLTLGIAPEFADLNVDVVERRLAALATQMDLKAEIMIAPLPARLKPAR